MKKTHQRNSKQSETRINKPNAEIGRRSKLDLKTKKRIHEAAGKPITYGASIRGQAAKTQSNCFHSP